MIPNPAIPDPATTAAVERLLDDFRAWLLHHPAPAGPPGDGGAAGAELPGVDLHTLIAGFTALRHEVNLQTRAARAQMETNTAALDKLGAAVDALDAAADRAAQDDADARARELRPLLNSLLEVHDALTVAQREGRRVETALQPLLERLAEPPPPPPPPPSAPPPSPPPPPLAPDLDDLPPPVRPGLLARLVGAAPIIRRQQEAIARLTRLLAQRDQRDQPPARNGEAAPAADAADAVPDTAGETAGDTAEEPLHETAHDAARKVRQVLDSLLAGYAMSLQRAERALQRQGLTPIPAEGEPFDPECMEALEAVTDTELPPGYVVTEVRRGYFWNDRLFRSALVRVSRAASPAAAATAATEASDPDLSLLTAPEDAVPPDALSTDSDPDILTGPRPDAPFSE